MRSLVLARLLRCLLLGVTWLAAMTSHAAPPEPSAESRWYDRYIDPDDGQFDLSDYLLKYRGLLSVPIIVTEPALGYGGGLAALWFKESLPDAGARGVAQTGKQAPPAIGALAAFRTQNGSSGGFAGYFTPLAGDRYRVLGGIGKVGLDLDYYDPQGPSRRVPARGTGPAGPRARPRGRKRLLHRRTLRVHGYDLDLRARARV